MKVVLTLKFQSISEVNNIFPSVDNELITRGDFEHNNKSYPYELLIREKSLKATGKMIDDGSGGEYPETEPLDGCFVKAIVDEDFCSQEVIPKSYWVTTETTPSVSDLNWSVSGLLDQSQRTGLLSSKKDNAKTFINTERDRIHGSGIEYNGHTFQTDTQSISDIMGAIVTDTDTVWLTTGNYQVDMTISDMKSLGLTIANRKKFLVYKAREFKDALEALTSVQEISDFVSNLDWSA